MQRPKALSVSWKSVPEELRAINRWVCWRFVKKKKPDGSINWAKVPFTVTGQHASSTNPKTWASYDDVEQAYVLDDFDGIGLVLGDDVQGIDLDDVRDPVTGELLPIAQEVLDKVEGYAEISPSGTGIKVFSRTNLDASRTKKEAGVELYREGRYFTVTGHAINGHARLPAEVQDLGWLVEKLWGDEIKASTDASERALELYKAPLEGWDADRIRQEIGPHLDLEMHYEEWIRVGQALYHQFEGDDEGFELWDELFQDSPKYGGHEYGWERWRSFNAQRARGRGPVTLASILKLTKDQRRTSLLEEFKQKIETCSDARGLQEQVAAKIANTPEISDMEREILAAAIQGRAKELGVKVPIATARGWVRSRVRVTGGFVHLNDDGYPLCTLENMRILIAKLGYVVRYNVIKKSIEILIPGAGFSRDNRDNAAIAHVLSECEKVRMSTKHVAQFLITLADENPYNPVATWIESRPWDGVSRLDEFFDSVRTGDKEALKGKLLRKWLVQAVAAAFSPDGIAGQGILTFVGPQNIGKTTWFQRLAPPDLDAVLTGHTLDTKSKDSVFIALSFWIVELGEVDATIRKSDISALKSFITQPLDKIRRPYAATESSFGRRTVFGATVNDAMYLYDATGNRRFWSLEVESFVLDHDIDMQQLWAEVLELWRAGEAFVLDQGEVAELNDHNETFTVVDPVEERVLGGFNWQGVTSWEWITATDALARVGITDPHKSQTISASRVLRRVNGGQKKKSNGRVLFAVPAEDFLQ